MIGSPLRYPGGKSKLFDFVADIIRVHCLSDCEYVEPYAGGGGLALRLLSSGYVRRVALNDVDLSIYAFWKSILEQTEEFCERLEKTPVTVEEWHRQKKIWEAADSRDLVGLGFATFFLNRTNRSGIIAGAGPIGGYSQKGEWKIDARYNKTALCWLIKNISKYSDQITITNEDALNFLPRKMKLDRSFIYLDPPYFEKGRKLYFNHYNQSDHENIRDLLLRHKSANWILSYDDCEDIRAIYRDFNASEYKLTYSAGTKRTGKEVFYSSDTINLPELVN